MDGSRAPLMVGRSMRAAKTGEMIAAYLRGRIVRGELREGDSLPSEAELMAQFEVSRPTLREAFRILETESLIVIRRGSRGARITRPRIEVAARYVGLLMQVGGTTLADVYEARTVVEPPCAGLLAGRATERDVLDLQACADRLAGMVPAEASTEAVIAFVAATNDFHELVVERAGNRTLAIQFAVLREVVDTHLSTAGRSRALAGVGVRELNRAVRSYRKLINLVRAQDVEGARAHWQAHMDAACHGMLTADLRSVAVVDLFTEASSRRPHPF